MSRLSVIVVRYLTQDWDYAEHLSRYTKDFDLISVDNTSADEYLTAVWNRWLRKVSTPYVCVMNPDVLVGPAWADFCLAAFESPRVVMAGPRVSGSGFEVQHEKLAGAAGTRLRARIEKTSARVAKKYRRRLLDAPIQGSCMVFDRNALLEMGGFDPQFRHYSQDTDIFLSVRARKLRCVIAMGAHVHHLGGQSAKEAAARGLFDHDAEWRHSSSRYLKKWGFVGLKGARVVDA